MNINDYEVKEGDIKVVATELKTLLNTIQIYHDIVCNNLELLDENEKESLNKGLQFTEYFQNKYIVLGEARIKQKMWFDILKKFDNKDFVKDAPAEQVEETRREVWGNYLEAKERREKIKREIDIAKGKLND